MTDPLIQSEHARGIAVLRLNRPPANALSQPARLALHHALQAAQDDADVTAVVLTGNGRGFCGGGELAEIGSPRQAEWPGISAHLLPQIESFRGKPVIAALHGFAVGGGFELALACHYRIAHAATRLALPEIRHGVVPPSGSQRLPRAVPLRDALALMTSGETVLAGEWRGTGLFEQVVDAGDVVEAAIAWAASLPAGIDHTSRLLRHRPIRSPQPAEDLAAGARRLDADPQTTFAQRQVIEVVRLAVESPDFDTGLFAAKRLHDELQRSAVARRPS